MWLKPQTKAERAEKTPNEQGASIYLEAYQFALDLCNKPGIAHEVAAQFVKYKEDHSCLVTKNSLHSPCGG
jgi:hypothetical protein